MNGIPIKEFVDLGKVLPKCLITLPKENKSWIVDSEGSKIGAIHWGIPRITFFKDYEHIDAVIDRLGRDVPDISEEFKYTTDGLEQAWRLYGD